MYSGACPATCSSVRQGFHRVGPGVALRPSTRRRRNQESATWLTPSETPSRRLSLPPACPPRVHDRPVRKCRPQGPQSVAEDAAGSAPVASFFHPWWHLWQLQGSIWLYAWESPRAPGSWHLPVRIKGQDEVQGCCVRVSGAPSYSSSSRSFHSHHRTSDPGAGVVLAGVDACGKASAGFPGLRGRSTGCDRGKDGL